MSDQVFQRRGDSGQPMLIFPASDKSPEIYWDQEFIAVDVGPRTILVTTSAPWSPDRRPTELAWIDEWLAGLKVPLND